MTPLALVVVVCLGLSAPAALAKLDDEIELVQKGLQSQGRSRHAAREEAGLGQALDAVESEGIEMGEESWGSATKFQRRLGDAEQQQGRWQSFNCTEHPGFCREPFNCHDVNVNDDPWSQRSPVAKNGHANVGAYCGSKQFYMYMKLCIRDKKLKRAGRVLFRGEKANNNSEMAASACFAEGHCTNMAVTEDSTLEDMEAMCDARFGHTGWANWSPGLDRGYMSMVGPYNKVVMNRDTGIHDPKITRYITKLSCAMGSFHCDVMTCKETYCKDSYYIAKYQKLAPATPGHLLRQIQEPF